MSTPIHIAVAVIINKRDEVCVSLRHKDSHQGGLWEFPGGKLENDETVEQALVREIREELGLEIKSSRPLITLSHDYGDKKVCLHVQKILSFGGQAAGLEGQQVQWLTISELLPGDFPAANAAIIKALQLPDRYLITGRFTSSNDFSNKLTAALVNGIRLVQLRIKSASLNNNDEVRLLLERASRLCVQFDAKLMLNLPQACYAGLDLSQITFAGFHADSSALKSPWIETLVQAHEGKLLSASCHDRQELERAIALNADFAVLSPVQKTASHPDMVPMGWVQFAGLVAGMTTPVYALGGVAESDMEVSWSHGAQGIAAISAFWGA